MAKKRKKYTVEELWNPQIDLRFDAAAYGRQSTKEQYVENVQSHISQTIGLLGEAKALGFKDDGSTGIVTLFVENQVVLEDGTTQIKNASGTWPIDKRPDLKTILDLIEEGKIKLVIVEFVDRLFRDEDRIDSNIFIKTCKENDCFVYVTSKKLIYNFANPQMAEMFRMEVQFAAAYIEHHVRGTMLRRRDQAVESGQVGGGYVPMGFIVCREKGDKYNKLIPYLPHAKIIKELAKKVLEEGLSEVARQAAKNPIIFPDFEEGIEPGHRALDKVKGGYILKSRFGLERLLKSPANIGDIKYGDSIYVKGAHDSILDKGIYQALLAKMEKDRRKKRYYQKESGVTRPATLKKILMSKKWKTVIYTRTGRHYHYSFQNVGMTTDMGLCISAELIESLVENRLIEKIKGYDLGSFENELIERRRERLDRIKWIDTRLSALDSEIEELTDSLVKTKIQRVINKINGKVAKFEQEMLDLEKERSEIEEDLKEEGGISIKEELSKINILEKSPKIRQAILELLIKQIEVDLVSSRYVKIVIRWKVAEFGEDEVYVDRGHTQSVKWKEEELAILRTMYPVAESSEVMESLPSHTWSAICHKAYQEGVKRHKRNHHENTKSDFSWSDRKFLESMENFTVGAWKQAS